MPIPDIRILQVAVGSENDLPVIKGFGVFDLLDEIVLRENYLVDVISGDRNLRQLPEWCDEKLVLGVEVFMAIAGMTHVLGSSIAAAIAHSRPVVPLGLESSDYPGGLDALLSMTRKPAGTATATSGVGKAGLLNGTLHVCTILAISHPDIRKRLASYVERNKKPIKRNINIDETRR